jgi:putative oxidoreductase
MIGLFQPPKQSMRASVGLLVIRLVVGAAFMLHGYSKIQDPLHWMDKMGENTPGPLQALAAISEFGGGIAWFTGLLVPLSSLGILSTMAVALYHHVVVWGQPFVAVSGPSFEVPAVYVCVAVLLILAGPGRLSLDALFFREKGE